MKYVRSDLICSCCGTINTIQRKFLNQRKEYHIKDLYCYTCKQVTKQIEIRDIALFKKRLEFSQQMNEKEQEILKLLENSKVRKLR